MERCQGVHLEDAEARLLGPADHVTPGESRDLWARPELLILGLEEGERRRRGCSRAYLKAEAVGSRAELLSAGQTVLLAAAGHTGDEAEQQEVTKQDFHGAGAGSRGLKCQNTREGGRPLEEPFCGGLT